MDTLWPNEFRERMRTFEGRRKPHPGEAAVSIKLRVNSGCFHREHSPHAYEMIDEKLRNLAKSCPCESTGQGRNKFRFLPHRRRNFRF